MILIRKAILWSLPIWCLLILLGYSPKLSNSIVIQIQGIMFALLMLPGFALVLLSIPGQNVHSLNIHLLVITNCLLYSCFLYLILRVKEQYKIRNSMEHTLN